MEISNPVIKITSLAQVCLIVKDRDSAMKKLWETFGIGPWNVRVRDSRSSDEAWRISDCTYYGKPAELGFKVATTVNKVDGVFIELIQPLFGQNIFSDFLKENGEGIQHLGWYTAQTQDEFKDAWHKLEAAGFPCIQSGRNIALDFAFFDTKKILGTTLEMLWRNPAMKTPPPQYIYPKI